MPASKRISAKQRLEVVLNGFESLKEVQDQHNKKIDELLTKMDALIQKMDTMIELLKKAGEIEVKPQSYIPKQSRTNDLTFSDL